MSSDPEIREETGGEGSPAEPPAPKKPPEMAAARRSSTQWIGRVVEWAFGLVVCGLFFVAVWLLAKFIPAPSWQRWLPLALEAIFIGLWCLVLWPAVKRWLADRTLFWLRWSEMKGIYVEKNKVLHKIIPICRSREKRERIAFALAFGWDVAKTGGSQPQRSPEQCQRLFEELRDILCGSIGRLLDTVDGPYPEMSAEALAALQPYVFLSEEPVWLGVPWIYSTSPVHEDSIDADRPGQEVSFEVDLRERVVDLEPPDFDTADRIQVRSKLVIYFEVVDLLKARFGVTYFTEALKKLVEGEWRQVLALLRFFEFGGSEAATEATKRPMEQALTKIHAEAHRDLVIRLGLGRELTAEEKEQPELAKRGFVLYPHLSQRWLEGIADKPVGVCFHSWGLLVRRVEVRDLDPVDPKIRGIFEAVAKARTENLVATQQAEATAKKARAPLEGMAQGIEALEALGVDPTVAYLAQSLPEVFKGMDVTAIGEGGMSQLLSIVAATKSLWGGGNLPPKETPAAGTKPEAKADSTTK